MQLTKRIEKIKRFFNKAEPYFRLLEELRSNKPLLSKYFGITQQIISIIDNLGVPDEYNYRPIKISSKILDLILDDLFKIPHKLIPTFFAKDTRIFEINDDNYGNFGLIYRKTPDDRSFLLSDDFEYARDFVFSMAAKKIKGQSLKLEVEKDELEFTKIDHNKIFQTEKMIEIKNDIKPYLDGKLNICTMLYGPPGTGKTLSAFKITKDLGLTTIVIDSSLHSYNSCVIMDILESTSPEAVIIDDFNYFSFSTDLGFMDKLKKIIPLIILTVNELPRNTAMLRPGRIDLTNEIRYLDKTVIENMLSPFEDQYEVVRTWPASYINAFKNELVLRGREGALKKVDIWKQVMKITGKNYKNPFDNKDEDEVDEGSEYDEDPT